jgi:hypothetical protein
MPAAPYRAAGSQARRLKKAGHYFGEAIHPLLDFRPDARGRMPMGRRTFRYFATQSLKQKTWP